MRARLSIVGFAIGMAVMPLPEAAAAAEIKLMCPAPMRTAMVELVAQFERATSHKVTIVHTPSRLIVERVRGGEAVDVTILTAHASDDLVKQGKLARRVDLARSTIGIAVRAGAPKPDASTVEAFKRTLLGAKSFARNEGAESGIHMLSVFDRLGIAEQMKSKTTAMPVGTGYVAELVARGEAEMAAQQMSELMAVPGVEPTPLPAELQLAIVFSMGVSPTPKDPDAVAALVKFLTSPAAAPVLRAKGLSPATVELRLLSNPGMKAILEELGPQFERNTGHRLAIQFGLIDRVKAPIDAGDFDVSISTGAVTDYLAKQGKIVASARMVVSRGGIGVAVRVGGPKPDISSTETFREVMLSAKSISYTQGSTVGNYLVGMFQRLGIADEMKAKTKLMGGGGQNPKAVAAGEVEFGLSLISDIFGVPGVELLGPLPPGLQNYVVETGDIGATAKDPQVAATFLRFLTTPAAAQVIKAKGMEPGAP